MTFQVRRAVAEDAPQIAQVHIDSWRSTYDGIISQSFLEQLSYDNRERSWTQQLSNPEAKRGIFVAETEEKIVGFAACGPNRSVDYPQFDGELYAIYLLQAYQGQGIGKELVQLAISELQHQHINKVLVWVLEDNDSRFFL